MKPLESNPLHAVLSLALALLLASSAFAQGMLNPPGAPAPTMRTLDQIEPRTIVNTANTPGDATNSFIISKPGSYYLTGNITGVAGKNGISIQAADVTLDLNGFAVIGPGTDGSSATGLRGVITSAAATNSCIRNGSARNWYDGVEASAAGMLVERLRLDGNYNGLNAGNGSIIRDCVATGNSFGYICDDRTQLTNCIASENQFHGFSCRNFVNIVDCTASRNGGNQTFADGSIYKTVANGFDVGASCLLSRCTSTRNTSSGISAGKFCLIVDCSANSNEADGIYGGAGNVTIRNSVASGNGYNGIHSEKLGSVIVGNTCDSNLTGILGIGARVDSNSCCGNTDSGFLKGTLLTRNTASGNGPTATFNYNKEALQTIVVVDNTDGRYIPDNISAWANFMY